MRTTPGSVALVACLIGGTSSTGLAQQTTFVVDQIPSLGGLVTTVTGLNDSGVAVGTRVTSGNQIQGFIFDTASRQLTEIPSLCTAAVQCQGTAVMLPNFINNTGWVVGRGTSGAGLHAFVYDPLAQTSRDIGTLGGVNSSALAVNDLGIVVGWSETSGGEVRGFRYDINAQTVTELPTLGGPGSIATAINNAGLIVGLADTGDGTFVAAQWECTAGCHVQAIAAIGTNSAAFAVNALGIVAGEAEIAGDTHAFATVDGHSTDLGTLGGPSSVARGIGANGEIVGQANISVNVDHAFLVQNGVMSDLNTLAQVPSGWVLYDAVHINTRDQIAVNGSRDGTLGAFILSPPLDTVPPQVNCGTDDGSWHRSNISMACQAQDAATGLADPSLALFTLSTTVAGDTETTNAQTTSVQVCDLAGNCTQAGPFGGIRVDRRAPSIAIAVPTASSYVVHSSVLASYVCNEAGSGLATCAGTVATGANVDTTSLGAKSFVVTATDAAGNQAEQAVSYTVTQATPTLSWRQVTTSIEPAARAGHKMVYDSINHKVVLFGGQSSSGTLFNDVWEFDTATETWTEVTPVGTPMPSGRSRFGMAFDRARNVVVMYGGYVGGSPGTNDETWEWSPATRQWTFRGNAGVIDFAGRVGAELAFDPNLNKVILFGGVPYWACPTGNGTYAWNGGTWTLVGGGLPGGRVYHAMATDFDRSRVVVYGGASWDCGTITNHTDTWEWDGSTWVNVGVSPNRPSTNLGVALEFDGVRHELVSFGGHATNESWVWQGNTWTLKTSTGAPSARLSSIAFDPLQNTFVLFGGHTGSFQTVHATGLGGGVGGTWVATRPQASTLSIAAVNAPYGSTVAVTASLSAEGGDPLPDRAVRFQLDASEYSATTGDDGVATALIDLAGRTAGAHALTVAFNGDASFAPATASTTLTIAKAVPSVDWPTPAPIVHGTPLPEGALNAQAGVPGSFTYMPPLGTMLPAGTHRLDAIFTPNDGVNYEARSVSVYIDVLRGTPSLAWTDPESIEYGLPLSAMQLNASASVPGTFSYTPAAGTILGLGTHTLSVIFAPADQTNYTSSSASVQLVVTQAQTSVNLSVGRITAFSHLVANLFATVQGSTGVGAAPPTGTLEFLEGTMSLGVMPIGVISPGGATILLTPTPGSHSYTARYSGDANYAPSASAILVASFEAPAAGALRGWGADFFGQLGDGGGGGNEPYAVTSRNADGSAITDVVTMATGARHSVIVRADGSAWAWGGNWYGEVGDGTLTPRNHAVRVLHADGTPFGNVLSVFANDSHTVALKQDGTVWAWGNGIEGQLGNGGVVSSQNPVQVTMANGEPLTGVVVIKGGYTTNVALRFDGTVWTWGRNTEGQLGDGTTTSRSRAAQVLVGPGQWLTGIASVWPSNHSVFAIGLDGTSWGWGGNFYGQLGTGSQTDQHFATLLRNTDGTPFAGASMIAGGQFHSVALKTDLSLWSWGFNNSGQLGIGAERIFRLNPGPVLNEDGSPLTGVTQIGAGAESSLALRDGQVLAFGDNSASQLGDGTTTNRWFPTAVRDRFDGQPLLNVFRFAAQFQDALAIVAQPRSDVEGSGDFGDQPIGTTVMRTLMVRSSGEGTLRFGATSSGGANASDFAITQDSCAGTLVPPGGACSISVSFTPTADGNRTASLFVATNSESRYTPVTLTGNAIQTPSVTLLSPNGGERVFANAPVVIRWAAIGTATSFDVALSRDGGGTITPIVGCENLAASATSCTWTPQPPSTMTARIRVTARNALAGASDTSDADFTIASGTPAITVTSPNTAVTWVAGSTRSITWSHNIGLALVRVELSRDGGASWQVLAPAVRNTSNGAGSFTWSVTGPATAAGLVRVTALDVTAADTSNVPFSVAVPTFTVTAPNSAVVWSVGTPRSITWTHNTAATERVHLDLSRDGGTSWEPLATDVPNSSATAGNFTWNVTGPATTNARVRVRWVGDSSASDVSNVSFTIASPTLTVTSINTAASMRIASTQTLRVSHNLGAGQSIGFDITRDGGATWNSVATTVTTTSANATASWVVTGPITTQARIRARWLANTVVEDQSDVDFTITSRITVTAPNTAVVWGAGSARQVTWKHNLGTTELVNIDVSSDGGNTWTPVASGVSNATATSGTFTGMVPGPPGTQALIRVSHANDPTAFDLSNVFFTLAAPAITVTTPNTNALWTIGSTRNINWAHNLGTLERVNVELSRDGGSSWEPLAGNVAITGGTSGRFSWVAAGPSTATARIRVSWAAKSSVSDTSNVDFRIQ